MDGLLIINKPRGWTSHDVVDKLRRILSVQKIGHTGTLDPDATGVLCVCIGKATRLAQYTTESDKEYRVVMKLGVETDTQDATGKVIRTTEDVSVSEEDIKEAFRKFTGTISQTPPMFSAVKIDGIPLYRLARKGKEVPRKSRQIFINRISLLEYSGNMVKFDVECSKGTYVRALCSDVGHYLGTGAHMYSLVRLRSGEFTLDKSVTLEDVSELHDSGRLDERLIRLDKIVAWMPSVMVKDCAEEGIKHGVPPAANDISKTSGLFIRDDLVRIINGREELLSICRALCDNNKVFQNPEEKIFKIEIVLV